ncbi:hypothetical protein P8H26_02210 [Pseudochrobactrum sp. sp1633]|uniref:hypothetical protein n=1 Tax=Pseudochrobactrum sp. sp1633 TaxID=3036706 RepID=UPI000EFBAF34|nr:hypothetical protein [Pseudochrobactrum sp. sp1633]MDM8344201.1 hypothetical protein [Pseudochrobactrum sp. sp1633]
MATATQDTRDRVIRMEGKVEELERKIDRLDTKVSEMHHLLTQAKGARWMLIFLVGFGGFIAANITPFVQYIWGR